MRTSVCVLLLTAGLMPTAALTQVPRDAPSPSIQNARRERELRALVASGGATRDTYIELTSLEITQNRLDDAVAALHAAAQLEPTVPEVQHMLATIAWEHANRDVTNPAGRLSFIREGVALEDRALTLKPDYAEAMTYKNILLRLQASLTNDSAEKARLIADADALRNRVLEMQGQQAPPPTGNAPASFSGFGEPYNQTSARLMPIRVGGSVRQPNKTHDAKPTYPAQAQTEHVQGVVIVELIIDPSGSVANARILRSIPALDEAALSAVSRWQFTPTLVNDAPVAVIMTVTVNFTLQQGRQ
jgi:TonB family protein